MFLFKFKIKKSKIKIKIKENKKKQIKKWNQIYYLLFWQYYISYSEN